MTFYSDQANFSPGVPASPNHKNSRRPESMVCVCSSTASSQPELFRRQGVEAGKPYVRRERFGRTWVNKVAMGVHRHECNSRSALNDDGLISICSGCSRPIVGIVRANSIQAVSFPLSAQRFVGRSGDELCIDRRTGAILPGCGQGRAQAASQEVSARKPTAPKRRKPTWQGLRRLDWIGMT